MQNGTVKVEIKVKKCLNKFCGGYLQFEKCYHSILTELIGPYGNRHSKAMTFLPPSKSWNKFSASDFNYRKSFKKYQSVQDHPYRLYRPDDFLAHVKLSPPDELNLMKKMIQGPCAGVNSESTLSGQQNLVGKNSIPRPKGKCNPRLFVSNSETINIVKPLFGVLIPICERENDLNFDIVRYMSILSPTKQTYTDWILFLVGDALSAASEKLVLNALSLVGIAENKFVYLNLDENESERFVYKHREPLPFADLSTKHNKIWCWAGTGALPFDIFLPEATFDACHPIRLR